MRASDAIMAVLLLIILWSFYRAHKDPSFAFNAFDLLMENGRVSKTAVVFMGAFAVMSWGFIRLVIDGKMSETLFASYGAMWVAPIISRMFAQKPSDPTPPAP